jgi:hypothetical protein
VSNVEQINAKKHPLTRYRPPIPRVPKADDMLIEGIISAKVSFFGAYAGAGKTTSICPLVLIVAGLIKVEGMDIMGWRRVIYISEHPEQVELSLKALSEYYNLDPALVSDRVKIVPAQRMSADDIVKAVPTFKELSVSHTENGVTVVFAPWAIIDTQASTLHVENENESGDASAAMAALKVHFDGVPLTVVAHTAKAHKRGDVEAMTIRGSGAFEGDCNQVMFLSYEAESDQRFIEIGIPKHRFTATVAALAVEFHTIDLKLEDKFKRIVKRTTGFCTLTPVSAAQKEEIKDKAKDDKKEAAALEKKVTKDAKDLVIRMAIRAIVKAADDAKDAGGTGESVYINKAHIGTLMQERGHSKTQVERLLKEMTEGRDGIRHAQALDKEAVGLPKMGKGEHVVMIGGTSDDFPSETRASE